MIYQNRDMGVNYIKARRDHRCYGMGLGIIPLRDYWIFILSKNILGN